MSDTDIHSCGYYCDRFACILRQRDEMRDKLFEEILTTEKNIQISETKPAESSQSLWRKRQNNSDVNRSQGHTRIINELQFFEWWNGDELVENTGYEKGTPIYWAIQGWQAANKQPWVKTYSGDKPNYTQPIHRNYLREIYEVWAGSEGIPIPETAAEAYLLQLIEQIKEYAVPLHELLAGVPRDTRVEITDPDDMGTQFIPVGHYCHEAAEALRESLAQPDPMVLHKLACRCLWIAYVWNDHNFDEAFKYAKRTAEECGVHSFDDANDWLNSLPQKKEWVGLTKEELQEISDFHFHGAFSGRGIYEDIEAKLKEKNGG